MSRKAFKRLVFVTRFFLGIIFLVFGINYFANIISLPKPDGVSGLLITALINSGYFFPFLKAVEIACGLALVTNKCVSLSLVVLAPITLNIFLFNFFLKPDQIYITATLIVAHLFLGYVYRENFKKLFHLKSKFVD